MTDEIQYEYSDEDALFHYGVLGMKWGVRKDGKPQGFQYGEKGSKGGKKGTPKASTPPTPVGGGGGGSKDDEDEPTLEEVQEAMKEIENDPVLRRIFNDMMQNEGIGGANIVALSKMKVTPEMRARVSDPSFGDKVAKKSQSTLDWLNKWGEESGVTKKVEGATKKVEGATKKVKDTASSVRDVVDPILKRSGIIKGKPPEHPFKMPTTKKKTLDDIATGSTKDRPLNDVFNPKAKLDTTNVRRSGDPDFEQVGPNEWRRKR